MRILLDECLPGNLKRSLRPHECVTVSEAGLSGLKNGKLLRKGVEEHFDVFLTVDKSLPYQQNTTKFEIAILVLRAPGNRIVDLEPMVLEILETLPHLRPGTVTILPSPSP